MITWIQKGKGSEKVNIVPAVLYNVLGLTLTIAVALAIAPILSEIAYASADPIRCGNPGAAVNNPHCNGGQIHVNVCGNPGAAVNNPHCN